MIATRFTARWVLPVTASPLVDGAVLVDEGGRIAAVGPAAAVPLPAGGRTLDLGEAVLLPGLVNTHAHPELTAWRGLLEDLPFTDWIAALVGLRRAAMPTAEELAATALLGCGEALAAGVTTIAATEDSGATLAALRATGMRGIAYREVFGPDPDTATESLATLQRHIAGMQRDQTALVRVGVSPHAPYTVSDALYRATAAFARAEQLPVAVHAAESRAEMDLVTHGTGPFARQLQERNIRTPPRGRSVIGLLEEVGILECQPLLIHCLQVDAEDVTRIAVHGATVAHCPCANARLGHGVAPLTAWLEAGIAVGLGSDSMASNNRMDMLEEARIAQLQQRAHQQRWQILPAHQLLRLATIEGARALHLDGRIGSLEPGKDADLCAVRLDTPHVLPVHDPLASLFFAARGSDVRLAVVQGRILYLDGRYPEIDLAAARAPFESLARRLRQLRTSAPGD